MSQREPGRSIDLNPSPQSGIVQKQELNPALVSLISFANLFLLRTWAAPSARIQSRGTCEFPKRSIDCEASQSRAQIAYPSAAPLGTAHDYGDSDLLDSGPGVL